MLLLGYLLVKTFSHCNSAPFFFLFFFQNEMDRAHRNKNAMMFRYEAVLKVGMSANRRTVNSS